MSTIAIITARGGSKRIPRKNIKEFMGKPIVAYAIETALKSKIFSEVMVSTDDDEIVEIAKRFGAKVPFKRSQETANDFASTEDVLDEVVNEYKKIGQEFDNICCIYPCVPLLTVQTLKEAYNTFANSDCNALMPVVRFSFPIQRAVIKDENNFLKYREPDNAEKRSQDLEPAFHDTGMFYFIKNEAFQKYRTLVPSKTVLYEMNESQIQDIDNIEDWKMAEIKYEMLNGKGGKKWHFQKNGMMYIKIKNI